ncbi:superfamily II DNA or RNA helicase [Kitasatospora sp. MAP12-15]|uniref:DEAD/DEAH box helicase n=1 Tax=unclassified Kitasatospora TaxID=2633591 RepID=UPI002475165D|nr:DEAD/DEAH box helicase [Kitasatospora sp. MAP12-44]MDH6111256.1 superfamily II DNA or RNA helicase [Kitasatospora sp. MAP12-44]
MFAVHGLWRTGGRLALWAEDARALAAARGPVPGGPDAVRPHPYACAAGRLAELLAGIGPGLEWLAGQAPERWATLALPSLSGSPAPSPELLGSRGASGVSLRRWRVPALLFEAAEAAQLLGELFDPRWALSSSELPGAGRVDVAYGASLRWLTGVHDLAWRLAGSGQVLPALTSEDGVPHARWQPVLNAAARREAAALAAGCPPVCRGEREGAELLGEVLDALTDREVRAALAEQPQALRLPAAEPAVNGQAAVDGLTERWFVALGSADGRLDTALAIPLDTALDGGALEQLAGRLADWCAGEEPAAAAVRLCFRLVEPLGPDPDDPEGRPSDDHWRLDFLLQAADEPSLLVPAADLWAGGAALAAFERKTDDPQASYLAELDRAARCRAELRPVLRTGSPASLTLDRAGALAFLREAAPVLSGAGFGVLLPSWWQRPPRLGMALTARPAAPGAVETAGQVDRDAVVAFRWQAAIDGKPLTAQQLADLAAAKEGLVRIRGQWVEVDARQIAAAVDFLSREGRGEMTPGRLLRLALDPEASVGGLPVSAVRASGVLGELLADRTASRAGATAGGWAPPVPLPDGFTATLRPYQERGVAWLRSLTRLGLGAVLADDMGLGKTVQTLALLAAEQAEQAEQAERGERGEQGERAAAEPAEAARPTLLVCPMSLVGNWRREAARFAPSLRVHVQHGAERPTGDELRAAVAGVDLVITTYGLVQRDAEQLRTIDWRRVIADEAQQVKNSATAQSRALRSLPADHRIALTGTPVENRLTELHAILDFANPGLLGSASAFKERYAIPVEQHGNAVRLAELQRRTSPFILRRLKGDPGVALELPAKQEMTVWCTLTTEQAGLYQAVVADLLHRVQGIKGVERKGTVLAAIGKLKQVCNHPAQLLHDGSAVAGRSGKLARLEETLESALAEGERTLVFTQYAEFGSMLHRHLPERLGTEVLYLHGGLSARRRDELIARFQEQDGPGVFLLSLKAGGTGLNLTAANQVIHLDRWWNPAVEQQATDRAHRIGQRRDVQVRSFVCVGTVEERIAEMIESKRALAETVVGAGGGQWLGDLSVEDLRELVTLTAEAEVEAMEA